jgi:hypothetical protein
MRRRSGLAVRAFADEKLRLDGRKATGTVCLFTIDFLRAADCRGRPRCIVGRYGRRAAEVAATRATRRWRPLADGEPVEAGYYQRDHEMACRGPTACCTLPGLFRGSRVTIL